MPNIASILKSEITRLARKEIRTATSQLQKMSSAHRAEIAALKRRIAELERQVKLGTNGASRRAEVSAATDAETTAPGRFSAKSMRSQRKRLGLTAAEMGTVIGASAQSVYNWEEGKVRPRERHLQAIFALRDLGRRDVRAQLAEAAAAG